MLYTGSDVIGVELGGAARNVIAIAAGTSDGLGFGANARSLLITRGLAEIRTSRRQDGRAGRDADGSRRSGRSVLTCTDNQSREPAYGLAAGQRAKASRRRPPKSSRWWKASRPLPRCIAWRSATASRCRSPRSPGAVIDGRMTPREAFATLASRSGGPKPNGARPVFARHLEPTTSGDYDIAADSRRTGFTSWHLPRWARHCLKHWCNGADAGYSVARRRADTAGVNGVTLPMRFTPIEDRLRPYRAVRMSPTDSCGCAAAHDDLIIDVVPCIGLTRAFSQQVRRCGAVPEQSDPPIWWHQFQSVQMVFDCV